MIKHLRNVVFLQEKLIILEVSLIFFIAEDMAELIIQSDDYIIKKAL